MEQLFYCRGKDDLLVDFEIHNDMLVAGEKKWADSIVKQNTIKRAINLFGIDKDVAEIIYK